MEGGSGEIFVHVQSYHSYWGFSTYMFLPNNIIISKYYTCNQSPVNGTYNKFHFCNSERQSISYKVLGIMKNKTKMLKIRE